MNLVGIHRTFHPTVDYIFFSSAHRKLYRIDHILAHKISLNRIWKIEIIPSIISNHNEWNYKTIAIKIGKHESCMIYSWTTIESKK
jgi:hypothetical protein